MAKRKAARPASGRNRPSPAAETKPQKRKIEQYAHPDKQRVNNPPVGLVTRETDPVEPTRKSYRYDPHLDPQLVWSGKAERTSFDVPSVSLHVHERIDPKTIIQAVRSNGDRSAAAGHAPEGAPPRQLSLFETRDANPPLRDALDFYKHPHGWTNRVIAGDSLLVMNSLLEKEGMAGKVQMIYLDPPYGIRYGSNFQPFVNRRDVKDGNDNDLSQEPEMIKAFRDTWELGIHSYLTYLRDRLFLARELLSDSGSVFVQIGDENVHVVRNILDEIFGRENSCGLIAYAKTTTTTGKLMAATTDYVLWYARSIGSVKFRRIFQTKEIGEAGATKYDQLELADGTRRPMTKAEREDSRNIPDKARPFTLDNLTSPRIREGRTGYFPVEFEGREHLPNQGEWKTNPEGVRRLIAARRVAAMKNTLRYVRFVDDFSCVSLTNIWPDIGGIQSRADPKVYVVQTSTTAVIRCLLMTTDPGDLVFDPTCGAGTTAYVAEQWGRRWITCDTSRVAITLAKQRLMTAVFDYYQLADPDKGVGGGLVYKTVPHVTLKSIANNPDIKPGMSRAEIDAAIQRHAEQETLYDQPLVDRTKARVSGPFTVEAVPAINVRPLEQVTESRAVELDEQRALPGVGKLDLQDRLPLAADVSIARYGESLRQRQWRDELAAAGVRGKSAQRMQFARLEPLPGCRWLNAEGETTDSRPQRVVVSFGPEHAPLEQRQVEQAWEEARSLSPRPDILLFAAFHFDPEAAKDIDELTPQKAGMLLLRSQMNTDLLTDDLKKKRSSNESFWLIGQPDVDLRQVKKGEQKGQWQVELRGFDYFNPTTGKIESGDTSKIAMWLLDTDYDGRSLYPRQVFFPLAGDKEGWARLAKNLKAEIDEELIDAYRGTESLPFVAGKHRRVGVKIVDDRGIESLKILRLED